MTEETETWTVAIDADTSALRQELERATRLGQQFGRSLTGALVDVAFKGKGLGDVLRSLTASLSRMVLGAAFKPLEQVVGSALSSLLGGGFAGLSAGSAAAQPVTMPFAKGGVIASPVSFPLSGAARGLAGESGPEAILPLTRGRDGRLGVASTGGAAPNIVFNIQTPDVDGFRRSQGQLAAMLARTVGRGQRQL